MHDFYTGSLRIAPLESKHVNHLRVEVRKAASEASGSINICGGWAGAPQVPTAAQNMERALAQDLVLHLQVLTGEAGDSF